MSSAGISMRSASADTCFSDLRPRLETAGLADFADFAGVVFVVVARRYFVRNSGTGSGSVAGAGSSAAGAGSSVADVGSFVGGAGSSVAGAGPSLGGTGSSIVDVGSLAASAGSSAGIKADAGSSAGARAASGSPEISGTVGSAMTSGSATCSVSETLMGVGSATGGIGKCSPWVKRGRAGNSSFGISGSVLIAGGMLVSVGVLAKDCVSTAGGGTTAGAAIASSGGFLSALMRTTTPAASMYCVRGGWAIDSATATAGAGVGAACSGPKSSAIWVSRLLILRFRLKNRSCIDPLGEGST